MQSKTITSASQTGRIAAARGHKLRCRGWRQEALLRLLENNLENAENPQELVVYASFAKAARNWAAYETIVAALKNLEENQTLIIQSGKPIGVLPTHEWAPLVVMANGNIAGKWSTPENFYALADKGLTIWGGLTAADWQYIGSQGVIQGTYEIFAAVAREHFGGSLAGRLILTAGLGGMGGAQPLAGTMAGAVVLAVEVDRSRVERRIKAGFCQFATESLDEALALCSEALRQGSARSVALIGNAASIYPQLVERGITPHVVTDQTSAHDTLFGYVPKELTLERLEQLRVTDPDRVRDLSLKSIVEQVKAMLHFKKSGSIVFDNGNNIRSQAFEGGVNEAFSIDIFTARYLRPLFCQGIGPFRWIALTGEESDIYKIDELVLKLFPENLQARNWIQLAQKHIKFEGLPARICWLGHGERTKLALAVNDAVSSGHLSGPIAFTRDHLDGAAMTNPRIGTEGMLDGSDAIADWPLLNAMVGCSSMADLVAIHAGGGGYSGYMVSAGSTVTADGTTKAAKRLSTALTNDTGLGVLRFADAGYELARKTADKAGLGLDEHSGPANEN